MKLTHVVILERGCCKWAHMFFINILPGCTKILIAFPIKLNKIIKLIFSSKSLKTGKSLFLVPFSNLLLETLHHLVKVLKVSRAISCSPWNLLCIFQVSTYNNYRLHKVKCEIEKENINWKREHSQFIQLRCLRDLYY